MGSVRDKAPLGCQRLKERDLAGMPYVARMVGPEPVYRGSVYTEQAYRVSA